MAQVRLSSGSVTGFGAGVSVFSAGMAMYCSRSFYSEKGRCVN